MGAVAATVNCELSPFAASSQGLTGSSELPVSPKKDMSETSGNQDSPEEHFLTGPDGETRRLSQKYIYLGL